jgi:hypothetical protein
MNYSSLSDWAIEAVDALVQIGVPREDARGIIAAAELAAISAEADARNDAQFLLDLRRVGSKAMAERRGMTRQGINKLKTKILAKGNCRLSAQLTG